MGFILLGHGKLEVDRMRTRPEMEFVAIPRGTTIQFYCDSNQFLRYGPKELDVWEQLQAPWPPLGEHEVTYNFTLLSAEDMWQRELANNPAFGGNTLFRAGIDGVSDPIQLCSGTPESCPTRPEQVAQGMTHKCDGVLGTLSGQLYWLACTQFVRVAPEDEFLLEASLAGRSASVLLGEDPDWVPGEADQQAIAQVNARNVMNAPRVKGPGTGVTLNYKLGGFAFLVGHGHSDRHTQYAQYQGDDSFRGRLRVVDNKFGGFDRFEIAGVPPRKQEIVRAAVSMFADVEITFM
ncbi:hypothetical protein [Streptomyces sp. NPDC093223]|uniref:hypothetical protein n=1 Tax=Streptomyces sp. NPDC093223 TaxID=3366033 RepID=UPI0038255FF5